MSSCLELSFAFAYGKICTWVPPGTSWIDWLLFVVTAVVLLDLCKLPHL